ncbi:MAG: hypothetical protein KDB27_29025 [Planctomycetales bacterium]|nr:hypothetical protein [Planctomycetales bacterium]
MKILTAITLLLGVFIASVMATSVSVLSSLDAANDIRIDDLTSGNLFPMFAGPTLWNQYPSLPPTISVISFYPLMLVGTSAAAVFYMVRVRLQMPLGIASALILILGAIPYAQGYFVLQTYTPEPHEAGPWIAVMLLGVLYSSVVAASSAVAGLVGNAKHVRANLR